jgi:hypothetical protein
MGFYTIEDLAAHSNYTELALCELGYNNVFPYVGANTEKLYMLRHKMS